jgi:hypothetical protein
MKSLYILFSVIMIVAFSCGVCSAEKKGSGVEGLVVDAQDKPLDGIKMLATQQKPIKGYEKFEVKTKSDGTFVIKGLYPESNAKPDTQTILLFRRGTWNITEKK